MEFLAGLLAFFISYKLCDSIFQAEWFQNFDKSRGEPSFKELIILAMNQLDSDHEIGQILDKLESSDNDLIVWSDGKYCFRSNLENELIGDYRVIKSHTPQWVDFMLNLDDDALGL